MHECQLCAGLNVGGVESIMVFRILIPAPVPLLG